MFENWMWEGVDGLLGLGAHVDVQFHIDVLLLASGSHAHGHLGVHIEGCGYRRNLAKVN